MVVDNTAPTVTISAPAAGTTVAGTTTVSASASDGVGVAGVTLLVDGAPLGAEDATAPYTLDWDTAPLAAGSHVSRRSPGTRRATQPPPPR